MLILVGKAGVGKSAVRGILAERLGMHALGPDDFPGRWDDVELHLSDDCILECCQIPFRVRERMAPDSVIVELTVSDEVRKERLKQQGLNSLEVAQRLLENPQGFLAYEDHVEPTMTVETAGAPAAVAAEIVGRL